MKITYSGSADSPVQSIEDARLFALHEDEEGHPGDAQSTSADPREQTSLRDEDDSLDALISKLSGLSAPKVKPASVSNGRTTWNQPGILGKARVLTSFGELPIEALRKRDLVKTSKGEFLAVVEIEEFKLDRNFLEYHPDAQPILIRSGALGKSLPKRDILISPEQKLCVQADRFDVNAKKAKDLCSRFKVGRQSQNFVTYYQFTLSARAMVYIEGVLCEVHAAR